MIEFTKRRLGRCPAVGRADNRRADGAEGHGIDTATAGIEQRHRVARLAKAEAGPQPVALPLAAPDGEQARLAKRGAVGEIKCVVVAIAQRPAGEIDRRLAKVSQLDKVRLGRERRLHVHLVDDDRRNGSGCGGPAGRTRFRRAVTPVRRRAGVGQRIDQLERVAVAVGQAWPGAAVVVVHLDDSPPLGVEQRKAFTVVRQAAPKPAVHRQAGVAQLERVGIVVGRQHEKLAGADDGVAGEGEVDAVKPMPAKRHIERAAVVQLDELVLTAAGRVVHDLGEAQRRPGAPGLE